MHKEPGGEPRSAVPAVAAAAAGILAIVAVAVATRLWVLTSVPIGFLFGFFLQKGDMCGAAACSEVPLMRDWRKLWGAWVCIVVSMVGFALLDLLGLARLVPNQFRWQSMALGGAVFGVGTVLAGGCVSGSLLKAGAGHLNSMVALPGIAIGVAMVVHGPLRGVEAVLDQSVVEPAEGRLSLPLLLHLPYAAVVGLVVVLTVVGFRFARRSARGTSPLAVDHPKTPPFSLRGRWQPWQSGAAIGVLAWFGLLSSSASGRNYPLGVTHGVLYVQLLLTDRPLIHHWRPPAEGAPVAVESSTAPVKHVNWWLIGVVCSLVGGSFAAARLSRSWRLLPKPPEQVLVSFLGGVLVGAGATLGRGCFVGNVLSGWALMSVGSILFGIVFLLANWVTTYFYLMGGTLMPPKAELLLRAGRPADPEGDSQ